MANEVDVCKEIIDLDEIKKMKVGIMYIFGTKIAL